MLVTGLFFSRTYITLTGVLVVLTHCASWPNHYTLRSERGLLDLKLLIAFSTTSLNNWDHSVLFV